MQTARSLQDGAISPEFKNFDLITPNEKEARFAIGDQDSTVDRLTKLVHENSNFKNIILKLGKEVFIQCTKPLLRNTRDIQ